ncbi:4-(cytidine 5'-diphospho)-2-C-methyl-D-erythritol kinase [methane-oxidizing endosymbiont of Gigantopelta aegis]|uniref:4-(cytidine 5'-diphospho)-2-C-methyl-D-erythritol kinase n=1 Tax=methane-oxidizing endosymbiont of Gigantopelta aegis TaxID=2794938 RepID=UPI0018DCC8D3|nr:4-(cytidine 5'-diphospho)-2-C-methyl-D-erythritol kinase [methane-oxidizing endosymbiont of Gigantopelta aegis]
MENKVNGVLRSGWGEPWPAPAKLNLMLRIIGRKDDGYHLLQTVFQMLDLCDWLTFHPLSEDVVRLEKTIPGVAENEDLTVRAARLLKQETGCQQGVSIEIDKRLPMGGGLGGGSSDAATTLLVLNHLWQLGLSTEKLMSLGLVLGADVPVFVFGKAAWAEGVGEKLCTIDVPESWYVVIKPEDHVDTGEIFSNKNLTRDSKPIKICDFLAGDSRNDCLEVVRRKYQAVDKALKSLSAFSQARLTGTGACVFAAFDKKEEAEKAVEALQDDWQVFLAKGQNISPLHQKLKHY